MLILAPKSGGSFDYLEIWYNDFIPISLAFLSLLQLGFLSGGASYEAIPVTKCQPGVFHLRVHFMLERAGGCHSGEEK